MRLIFMVSHNASFPYSAEQLRLEADGKIHIRLDGQASGEQDCEFSPGEALKAETHREEMMALLTWNRCNFIASYGHELFRSILKGESEQGIRHEHC